MQPLEPLPIGSQVVLTQDHLVPRDFDMQPGDQIVFASGKMEVLRHEPRLESPTLPTGIIGIVDCGPYSGGMYDFSVECPVRWYFKHPLLAQYLGTPWEKIELLD